MIERYKYKNWSKPYPSNIFEYMFSPTNSRLRILNSIFQKLFGINGQIKFMVHFTSQVYGNVTIGKNVARSFANSGSCYIQAINGIIIGDDTIFAPGTKLISANHDKNDLEKHIISKPIKIGKRCWLGVNSIILPGIELGDNVIVGAGSIVTKSFPSDVVIAGNPARIININKDL